MFVTFPSFLKSEVFILKRMSLLYGGRALFKCRREGGRSGKSGNGFDVAMMGAIIYHHFVHLEDIFQKINLNTFLKKYNFNKYGNLKTIS